MLECICPCLFGKDAQGVLSSAYIRRMTLGDLLWMVVCALGIYLHLWFYVFMDLLLFLTMSMCSWSFRNCSLWKAICKGLHWYHLRRWMPALQTEGGKVVCSGWSVGGWWGHGRHPSSRCWPRMEAEGPWVLSVSASAWAALRSFLATGPQFLRLHLWLSLGTLAEGNCISSCLLGVYLLPLPSVFLPGLSQ